MDARTFDRLTTEAARRPTRRSLLRLLAGSLVAGLLAQRGTAPVRAAQRPDRDGDGLYDDDETDVYGTNPDVFDTDGDGVGDGEEVYLGTDPLTPAGGAGCPAGQAICGGVCINIAADPANCGACGSVCPAGQSCYSGVCLAPAPSSDLKCAAQGLSACGGVCTNTLNDNANCGACGNSCSLGGYCEGGACAGTVCLSGLVDCGTGYCADLSADPNHCGACFNSCPLGGYCQGGVCTGLVCTGGLTLCYGICVDLSSDWSHCGGCEFGCFAGATCVNGACVD